MGNCDECGSAETNEMNINDFIQRIKNLHDDLRKKYHSQPLNYENEELNDLAKIYAKELMLNEEKAKYKTNIYKGDILGESVIISDLKDPIKFLNAWQEEGENYDFQNNKFSKNASHFTQIIWKDTKDIGIGFFPDKYKKEIEKYCIVIFYYPPGNILGNFKQNVTN